MPVLSCLLSLKINVVFLIFHGLCTSSSYIFSWAGVHQTFLHVSSPFCFSLCSFILVFGIVSPLIMNAFIPYDFVFQVDFLIKFIFQLSSLFNLHLLIPISVSERNDYFCFDSANDLIWLLHLQVPFSWLPPCPLISDNASTCDWLLNWIDFFVVLFITFISYSIIHFFL